MKSIFEQTIFKEKYSILFQIFFGIFCGFLNRLTAFIDRTSIPLYLDTIFTVAASFFGYIAGFFSIIFFHVFSFFLCRTELQISTLLFSICSVTIVFAVRLTLNKFTKIPILKILFLSLLITPIISIEGGIIYTFIFEKFNYIESQQIKYLTFALLRQNISVIVSSIFVRIPINLIDKTFSIFVGYFFAIFVNKLILNFEKKSILKNA